MKDERRLKNIWRHMLRRCHYDLDPAYQYYGGRGIKVCPAWRDFDAFYRWAVKSWESGLELDREDNDGWYCPFNCRFVSKEFNNCNRGRQCNNTSGYVGVTYRKAEKSWEARIRYQRKAIHLGRFKSPEGAVRARNAYILKHGLPFPIQPVSR